MLSTLLIESILYIFFGNIIIFKIGIKTSFYFYIPYKERMRSISYFYKPIIKDTEDLGSRGRSREL
jgi:hypothetical protein